MKSFSKILKRKWLKESEFLTYYHYDILIRHGEEILKEDYGQLVLISINIKEFKEINEQLGYAVGSEMVEEIIRKLKAFFSEQAEIFRRCDSQMVLLMHLIPKEELQQVINKLTQYMRVTTLRDGRKIETHLIMGIYPIPNKERSMLTCLNKVDIALEAAKKNKEENYAFYNTQSMEEVYQYKLLETQLRQAIDHGQFEVFLQPKIDLNTHKVRGAEALARWKVPYNPGIGPDVFIPILERNGLIKRLDFFILEQVCKKIRTWSIQGGYILPVAVNLSKTYMKEKSFIEDIMYVLEAYQVKTKFIELEITESTSLEGRSEFIQLIEALKEKGFSIAMDDFGTGYSSLSLLKDLPIDVLKLDKGFGYADDFMEKIKLL